MIKSRVCSVRAIKHDTDARWFSPNHIAVLFEVTDISKVISCGIETALETSSVIMAALP